MHVKSNKLGLLGRILLGAGAVVGLANDLNGVPPATFEIKNKGDSTFNGTMFFKIGDAYTEGQGPGDTIWGPSPNSNTLEAYSISTDAPFDKLDIDSKPFHTPGIDVNLAVVGDPVTSNNQLIIKTLANTGLEHMDVVAYNVADPNIVYQVDTTVGVTTTINLPGLVNQPEGVYGIWRVAPVRKLAGDVDGNGDVDLHDADIFFSEYMTTTLPGIDGGNYNVTDTNFDRITNGDDMNSLYSTWLYTE